MGCSLWEGFQSPMTQTFMIKTSTATVWSLLYQSVCLFVYYFVCQEPCTASRLYHS